MTDEELAKAIDYAESGAAYNGSGRREISNGEYLTALYEVKRLKKEITRLKKFEPNPDDWRGHC